MRVSSGERLSGGMAGQFLRFDVEGVESIYGAAA